MSPVQTTPPGAGRPADLRLARLHLRTGAWGLARAELEALAGTDLLDSGGVLDLAEVRWRTGDLPGAAAAAVAWLEDGGEHEPGAVMAHVVVAEAAAAGGRDDLAAGHVQAALAGLPDRASLEALLAGIAALAPWPWERTDAAVPALDEEPGPEAAPARPAESGPALPEAPAQLSLPTPGWESPQAPGEEAAAAGADAPGIPGPPPAPPETPGAPMVAAAASLVRAGASLLAPAPDRAAVLLALALRADRAAAEAVLAALDAASAAAGPGPTPAAALAFVRAEALRAAGRHEEARIAYASAERLALAPAEAGPSGSPR